MRKANKKLASAIVLGLMLAVPVGASAAEVTYPIHSNTDRYESNENVNIVNSGDEAVEIEVRDTKPGHEGSNYNYDNYRTYGIYGEKGIHGEKNDVILTGNEIVIESSTGTFKSEDPKIGVYNETRTVYAEGVNVQLGNESSNVTIKSHGDSAMAMFARGKDSSINVNAKTLNVVIDEGDSNTFGIHVQNNTQLGEDDKDNGSYEETIKNAASIKINADKIDVTNKNKNGLGLSAFSNGQMNITGNLTVTAKNAIDTRGNATININTDGKHTTVLNGDIVFETPYTKPNPQNSGNRINSNVNINLSGEESSWTGKAYQEYQVEVVKGSGKYDYTHSVELDTPDEYEYGNVTGFSMNINNGASWNMTGNSFINNVTVENGGVINVQKDVGEFNVGIAADSGDDKGGITLNNGVINLQGEIQQITVTELDGTGGTVNTNSLYNKMNIKDVDKDTAITVNGSGDIADEIYKDSAKAQDLANVVTSGDKSVADKVTTDEGIIAGRYEFDVDDGGNVAKSSYTKNTKNEAISNMASIGLMSWRAQNNDMNKRLGELRNSNGEHGVWARMVRGESEYGAQNVKNQYNIYQLGYDEKLSTNDNWTVGAAISYSEGNSSFEYGSGEDKSTGFAVYGSYLGDNGEFVDLIAKYARLDNEFDVTGGVGSGDYSTNGYSFSAEYGKRNELANDFYFEPQVELTYGRVADVDFVTKNGAKVSQDSMDSLVGRVGFAAGKNIKNGNVYVRASYLYDFDGETNVTFSNTGASESFSEDLGGGWFEFGIGTNINLSDATYLYFDVEKTTGGEVDTNWQWNAGVRYSF